MMAISSGKEKISYIYLGSGSYGFAYKFTKKKDD